MASYTVIGADGSAFGPVDESGLVQWVREGRVNASTMIQCQSGKVVPASSLPFVAAALGLAHQQPVAAAPAPAPAPAPMPYSPIGQVVPADSPQARMHALGTFSVAGVVLLHLVTFGLFSLIYFGLMHDKMPKLRHDDPSAGKAIGFMFIPFFNFYWMFFMYIRLCDRIAEQRQMRGLPPENLRGLAIAACILSLIPYLGILAGAIIMDSILFGLLQSRVNELAETTARQAGAMPAGQVSM
jgi:hypothetical protein